MKRFLTAALVSMIGCTSSPPTSSGYADLIVHHAKIISVDRNFGIYEAIAIEDGRILALGPDEEIFKLAQPGKTRIIDAEGHPILPGLYDSHVHLLSASASEISG